MKLMLEIQRALGLAVTRAPASVLRTITGPPRTSPEGFVLDPQVQALIRMSTWMRRPGWHELGVAGGRRYLDASCQILAARGDAPITVRDEAIPVAGGSITLRFYRRDRAPQPQPIVVCYHGGGFVLGSLASHDDECRELADSTGAVVISVAYRLAPEHPYPTPLDDGLAAFRWVAANAASFGGDAARIAVAGDSAGGNLAAVVARETRSDAIRPVFQLLIYPALDMTRSLPSQQIFREGLLLDDATMTWFLDHYIPSAKDREGPRASPLLARDHEGLPPAMIMTAGFDPLRDDGQAYADALRAAGVPVQHRCYEGLTHGFLAMDAAVDAAAGAMRDAALALTSALRPARTC